MTKQELLSLWESNKETYASQEIGSGTQSFVRNVIESSDVFGLGEGSLKQENYTKKSDYVAEIAKNRNRADFVLRISDEIQIPIEVEKYGNIKAGIEQLARYQSVWDMKYGILTDGYEWRFYIGTRVYGITLNELLDDSFQTFWQDYIKIDNYYLFYFDHHEQGKLFKDEPKDIELEIGIFFENITTLIRKFRDKLKLEQYFTDTMDQKEKEKRATEITYAYIIQFILYKVLVDNKFSAFKDSFDDIREAIAETLKQPSSIAFNGILNLITRMTNQISENIYRPFAQEQKFISKKLEGILTSPKNTIVDIAPWLDMFVFIDGFTFKNIKNEIFGHVYENYLKELYAEENRGQYFTHPAVVDFMLKEIGYTEETLRTNDYQDMSIIDPSCGSGTFLYKIVDIIVDSFGSDVTRAKQELSNLVHENVFGLDIEEFPLYLAEMSILMRMLSFIVDEEHNNAMDKKIKVFKTHDSVAEFIGEAQESNELFTTQLALGYDSFMRDEANLNDLKDSLKGSDWKKDNVGQHAPRRRFNYVIGNPPYIEANTCYKQKVLIYDLIKQQKVRLNNVHGMNLHSIPNHPKKGSPKINLWSMFVALGQGLLKDNGTMSYIIPQTLLTQSSYDVLRYYLSHKMVIEKIFIFANKLFIDRGIKTKKPIITSSLVFVVKKLPSELDANQQEEFIKNNQVELIRYNIADKDPVECMQEMKTRKNCTIDIIPQTTLKNELRSWNHFFKGQKALNLLKKYTKNSDSIQKYYDHGESKKISNDPFYFDIWYNFAKEDIKENKTTTTIEIGSLDSYFTLQGSKTYIEREKLELHQGNQGYHLLDSTYKIIWEALNTKKFYFSDKNITFRGKQFCAIGSENPVEILYLFILLNSTISKYLYTVFVQPDNENKKGIIVRVTTIKQFIRVPIITEKNQSLKDRLIVIAQQILDAEKPLFKDCLDLSHLMVQKFTSIELVNNELVFTHGTDTTTIKLKEIEPLRIQYNLNLYLKEHKNDLSLLTFKTFPCVDNILIDELMTEANTIIYSLYGMDKDDISVIEGG